MKKIIVALIFFFTISGSLMAQVACETLLPNKAFSAGEKITYKVIYNWNSLWLNGGEASFEVSDGVFGSNKVFHVIGEGTSYKSYDWFFKVRDTYESYIDQHTLQPLKFIRNVNEGGYIIYNNVTFNQSEHKAISTHGEFNVPSCIQDVLSAIYFTRNIDFNSYRVNDTIPVNLFLDDSVYHIYIRYLGKESVKIKSGTFNCIKFRPLLISGTIFKGGEKMTVWVTDDGNKIPVLVESPILIGFIRAELHDYQGLRNPMTSKTQ